MSGDERGMSPALELTVLLPALVMLIMLVVGASRIWWAQWSVRAAADSAARQASISRTAGEAVTSAEALVRGDAASSGLRCSDGLTVTVDAAGFGVPVGQPASVGATVRCGVALSDLFLPGWPGTYRAEASARSILDRYRGRR